ncbi:MAG: hypothetical protein RLZZ312_1888 [Bacteroidota bacterium]
MRTLKFKLFLLVSVVLFACKNPPIEKPSNLINQDKMIDVLYDVAILEAIKVSNPGSLRTRGINSKTYIYKKFKIDSIQFAKSDKYYAADIKQYGKMYQEVIDRINAEKTADSLKNLPKSI